jgi:hypothetical protein
MPIAMVATVVVVVVALSLSFILSIPPILPLASLHIINQAATYSSSCSSAAVGFFFFFLVGGFFYFQGPTTRVYVSFSGQKWFAATWGWGGWLRVG